MKHLPATKNPCVESVLRTDSTPHQRLTSLIQAIRNAKDARITLNRITKAKGQVPKANCYLLDTNSLIFLQSKLHIIAESPS